MADSPGSHQPNTVNPIVDRVKQFTSEMEKITEEKNRLAVQAREAKNRERQLLRENEEIRNKLSDLELDNRELNQKDESHERQMRTFKERVIELSQQKETLENQLMSWEGTAGNLRTGRDLLSTKVTRLESELTTTREKCMSVQSDMTDSRSEMDILRRETQSLRDRLFESEADCEKFSSANAQLEKTLNETRSNFSIMTTEKNTTSVQLDDVGRERDLFYEEIDQLQLRIRSRRSRIIAFSTVAIVVGCFAIWSGYTMSSRAISSKLNIALGEITTMSNTVTLLERELKKRKNTVVDKDKEIKRGMDNTVNLQKEIETLRGELVALNKNTRNRIAVMEQSKQLADNQAKEEMSTLEMENELRLSGLGGKIEKLEDQIRELRRTKGIVIPPLIAAVDHPDISVRSSVANALTALTGKTWGKGEKGKGKWQDWWFKNRLKPGYGR